MLEVGTLFFAYGCHMDPDLLAEVTGIERRTGQPARTTGWRLAFNVGEGGAAPVASLVEDPDCATCGVVYRLPQSALVPLDDYEGVPEVYRRTWLWVEPLGRPARQAALVYLAVPDALVPESRPASAYLERLVRGAELHGLPADYIHWLRRRAAGSGERCYSKIR